MVSQTDCTYKANADPNDTTSSSKSITIELQRAKTTDGVEANKRMIDDDSSSGMQSVGGIGDKAFYNSGTYHIDILKGNNYYTVGSYTNDDPSTATLQSDLALAKVLNYK